MIAQHMEHELVCEELSWASFDCQVVWFIAHRWDRALSAQERLVCSFRVHGRQCCPLAPADLLFCLSAGFHDQDSTKKSAEYSCSKYRHSSVVTTDVDFVSTSVHWL